MGGSSFIQEGLGGQMLGETSNVARGKEGSVLDPKLSPQKSGQNRSTSLGAKFWVTRLISYR